MENWNNGGQTKQVLNSTLERPAFRVNIQVRSSDPLGVKLLIHLFCRILRGGWERQQGLCKCKVHHRFLFCTRSYNLNRET